MWPSSTSKFPGIPRERPAGNLLAIGRAPNCQRPYMSQKGRRPIADPGRTSFTGTASTTGSLSGSQKPPHHEPTGGLEPPTFCPNEQLLYHLSYADMCPGKPGAKRKERKKRGGHVTAPGASEENRTPITSLEGWGSTVELHPQIGDPYRI